MVIDLILILDLELLLLLPVAHQYFFLVHPEHEKAFKANITKAQKLKHCVYNSPKIQAFRLIRYFFQLSFFSVTRYI